MLRSARQIIALRRVHGSSMEPALRPGMIVLAVWVSQPRPGQIVIFRHNGMDKIKRVAKVADGRIYVTGDNTAVSTDSRDFGWIDARQIIGRIIWPFSVGRA